MPQASRGENPYGLPKVVLPMVMTGLNGRRPLMTSSLADAVAAEVMTKTRLRFSSGVESVWLALEAKYALKVCVKLLSVFLALKRKRAT